MQTVGSAEAALSKKARELRDATREFVENEVDPRGSYTGELYFEDCEVPAENVLEEMGRGYANALRVLAAGRAGLPARNLGSCQRLLELSLAHAKTREQFGAPIFEQQIIQHYLAEIAVEIEALRAMVYRVAAKVDSADAGQKIVKDAAMVKLYGSEVYNRVAEGRRQGGPDPRGAGYMKEHEIERYYRDARITRIYEGTSETQ